MSATISYGWQAMVSRNHELIAGDLEHADAVLLGWGGKGSKSFVRELTKNLFQRLNWQSTWAFHVNQKGRMLTPRHAAFRRAFDIEGCHPQPFPLSRSQ